MLGNNHTNQVFVIENAHVLDIRMSDSETTDIDDDAAATSEEPYIHDVDDGDEVKTSEESQNLDEHMRKEINDILTSLQHDEVIKARVQKKDARRIVCQKNPETRKSLSEVSF